MLVSSSPHIQLQQLPVAIVPLTASCIHSRLSTSSTRCTAAAGQMRCPTTDAQQILTLETRKVASYGLTLSALPLCCGWHQWTYVCRYSERGTSRHPRAIINKKRQSSWSNNYLKYFRAVFKSMPELTEW